MFPIHSGVLQIQNSIGAAQVSVISVDFKTHQGIKAGIWPLEPSELFLNINKCLDVPGSQTSYLLNGFNLSSRSS